MNIQKEARGIEELLFNTFCIILIFRPIPGLEFLKYPLNSIGGILFGVYFLRFDLCFNQLKFINKFIYYFFYISSMSMFLGVTLFMNNSEFSELIILLSSITNTILTYLLYRIRGSNVDIYDLIIWRSSIYSIISWIFLILTWV